MTINLKKGWRVIEDVHEMGEMSCIFRRDFDSTKFGGGSCLMAPWTPIDRLEHLQLTFAQNPYYGQGLRQFNDSSWWYRNEFTVEEETTGYAVLTFLGVDYFADVYLNEQLLGSHEGYNTPFSFEVGDLIRRGEPNVLVVKVRAPWENVTVKGWEYDRCLAVLRDQMKGTYEHSDTFIPRDVNPIGIWNDVLLQIHNGIRMEQKPDIDALPAEDYKTAAVCAKYRLDNCAGFERIKLRLSIREYGEPEVVAQTEKMLSLEKFSNTVEETLTVSEPKLWTIRERGEAHRYTMTAEFFDGEKCILSDTQQFGIRRVEIVRTPEETTFYLNGEKLYLRGTSYFPDVYVSAMSTPRYVRDLDAAEKAGMNVLRIHVHQEKEEFYDMCDERGILLVQDSDFNWVHPDSAEWGERATEMYREMLIRLKNHPSICCWVCLNEPRGDHFLTDCPGPQMVKVSEELDRNRPFIKSSWAENDPQSGDSHNYEGSLFGHDRHYTDIYGTSEKLNTEFGMDAPPAYESLRKQPVLCELLKKVVDGIDSIQYYQYRYTKYFIEHYRMQKFSPCSGHFQFLFTDVAPTSFFGAYDWYGMPKYTHRAFRESNQPIGIFMECTREKPVAVYAVNDLLKEFAKVHAVWKITDEAGTCVFSGEKIFCMKKNGIEKLSPLEFVPDPAHEYKVHMTLRDEDGSLLAENTYESAFNPPEHPLGHPDYAHHGIGMRLFWAWM